MNEHIGSTKQMEYSLGLQLLKSDNMGVGFAGTSNVFRTVSYT